MTREKPALWRFLFTLKIFDFRITFDFLSPCHS